ncbi:hypothetical protein SteCoe_11414 [Stentor coeruleus]|uniref:EF-hand domain-containing protein n=1 Tax=Stentor coeruleus TaxID=5963 RepID=A0A1R2CD88_9CILI|nr:hypothetical protein SteCoe_11414 [Stentor coeruleus]
MSRPKFVLLLITLIISCYSQTDNVVYRLFEKEDSDNDGKLTTSQFIEGLISAFVNMGVENDKQSINDFGWEFAGHKKTKGSIPLAVVNQWIQTDELRLSFIEWKYISEEGEAHHLPGHKHFSKKKGF